ncbi:MAG TPA: ATP-binding protein, partial [Frankiaceae bacterium]|nr:ATP-binding protein [Frankiaceae bacterium]
RGRPPRPLDPASGPVAAFAAQLRTFRQEAGEPSYAVMASRVSWGASVLAAAARGERLPIWEVTEGFVRALGGDAAEVARWRSRWEAADRAVHGLAGQVAAPAPPVCPYPGLAPFDAAGARFFCGRRRLVGELVETVRTRLPGPGPHAVVIGASGAGKSSLLRAGLLPEAAAGGLCVSGSERWPCEVLTPTADPVGALAAAVASGAPGRLVRNTVARLCDDDPAARLVLVVDQLEEVFTLCTVEQEREGFRAALEALSAPGAGEAPAAVVIGVRADAYGRCADHGWLSSGLRHAQVVVGAMNAAEVREAVVQPAARAGLELEAGLVEVLLRDLGLHGTGNPSDRPIRPGGLPLLGHCLLATWQQRAGSTLTLAGYAASGGVDGAVALTADRLYESHDEAGRVALRRTLLRLVHLGEGPGEDGLRRADPADLVTDQPTRYAPGRCWTRSSPPGW